jgi:peptidoglycan glycosyltransferase
LSAASSRRDRPLVGYAVGEGYAVSRNAELLYLLLVGVAAVAAYVAVFAARFHDIGRTSITYGLIFVGIFIALHLVVRVYLSQADPYLLPLTALLAATGLTEIYRIDPDLALKQGEWLVVGAVLFIFTVVVVRAHVLTLPFPWSRRTPCCVLSSPAPGSSARLSLRFVGSRSNPRSSPDRRHVFLAGYLNGSKEPCRCPPAVPRHRRARVRYFAPLVDMFLTYHAGLQGLRHVAALPGRVHRMPPATSRSPAWSPSSPSAPARLPLRRPRSRALRHLDRPWHGAVVGYQVVQSLFAMADSVFGSGFGRGYLLFPNKVPVVPDLSTDFIFAAVANELGLAGAVGVILCYVLFAWRGFHIAVQATDGFSKLLAAVSPRHLGSSRSSSAAYQADPATGDPAVHELRRQLDHGQPDPGRPAPHDLASHQRRACGHRGRTAAAGGGRLMPA